MARDAGANKVYFASASPPVRFPNVYGIDMPTRSELVANGRSVDEVRAIIGADNLIYQDVAALRRAVSSLRPDVTQFEGSCFDGKYVTGDIDAAYLDALENSRNSPAVSQLSLAFSNDDASGSPLSLKAANLDV
jgi:amidophosphoribosyltransferase